MGSLSNFVPKDFITANLAEKQEEDYPKLRQSSSIVFMSFYSYQK